ncbi:MAG: FxsA family protein [Acidimicrobiia bacterium]
MLGFLALVFLVVPLAELAVIIRVGQKVGVLETLAVLIGISITGAWLAKRAGIGVMLQIRRQLEMGRPPGAELVDAALIVFAGALLLTPGFLTDIAALALLMPPVRGMLRRRLQRRFGRHLDLG